MRWLFWRLTGDEKAHIDRAERELNEVRDRWPEVREAAAKVTRHRQLNGWTETVRTIFGGHA